MGNYAIVIIGHGGHHQPKGDPTDANEIFQRFVDELRKAGQVIEHASFTHGALESGKLND